MDKRTCSGASPNMFHLRYWKSSPVKYKVIYIGLYKQPTIYLRNNVARRGNGIVFSRVLEDHRYLGNALRTAMLFTSPSGYVFTLGSKRPHQVFTEARACPGENNTIPSPGGPSTIPHKYHPLIEKSMQPLTLPPSLNHISTKYP